MFTGVPVSCVHINSCYLSLCRNQCKYILGNVDLSVESGQLSWTLVDTDGHLSGDSCEHSSLFMQLNRLCSKTKLACMHLCVCTYECTCWQCVV